MKLIAAEGILQMLYLVSLVSDNPPGTGLVAPERDVSTSEAGEGITRMVPLEPGVSKKSGGLRETEQ